MCSQTTSFPRAEGNVNLVLGVDPGLSGALAVVDIDAMKVVAMKDMPRANGSAGGVDEYAVGAFVREWASRIRVAIVEDVGVMGGREGTVSMFNFGRSAGVIHGALGVCSVPSVKIKPAIWKLGMGLGANKSDSLIAARSAFPKDHMLFARKMDDGRAEAALIALFGGRRL